MKGFTMRSFPSKRAIGACTLSVPLPPSCFLKSRFPSTSRFRLLPAGARPRADVVRLRPRELRADLGRREEHEPAVLLVLGERLRRALHPEEPDGVRPADEHEDDAQHDEHGRERAQALLRGHEAPAVHRA
jgi:hypothetical protein